MFRNPFMLRSVHEAKMETEKLRLQFVENKLGSCKEFLASSSRALTMALNTNSKITAELLLLRGGVGRVRTEAARAQEQDDPYLAADIVISSDESEDKAKLVEEARAHLNQLLEDFDANNVSSEAVAAATPEDAEDWSKEHEVPQKNTADPIAAHSF